MIVAGHRSNPRKRMWLSNQESRWSWRESARGLVVVPS
ncbi:hypothetical protein BMAPRL20_0439 [Burkholderia mallei PRL-20]|uniref:Uncharacterized protein n=1 Tax=Burkholderia pseudomallei (strain 1106a) TaxID=357348 RepID=A3P7R8_BURP0|nr:hypothetical protein BURPS1106A_A2345 [Burkholderia pseudomallei 1106a]EDK86451.1 hypothetical protein BMA721280_I0337 [Burkholderia mallei 2002721280]EEP49166.1 conserved hypothetical protein [Burkholderia pseudomallei MSHR346]EEP87390.1 conserved hypothetical protein [Burkholderia mallei GB8 horse 4]EES23729.1 hypothetical protein BURPS1106B_2834 [Burkholderia pseudomallei 1106b]EES46165.1 hypothetical protein BMAPRL20_0439 [Burkholderia mallei PRL-20]KGC62955.1 hypothetical protein DM75